MDPFQSDNTNQIDALAEHCLSYLVGNPEELSQFMQYAGLTPDALRAGLGSRELGLGMLDYFAQNESALMAMCANASISATGFMQTWQRLNRRD